MQKTFLNPFHQPTRLGVSSSLALIASKNSVEFQLFVDSDQSPSTHLGLKEIPPTRLFFYALSEEASVRIIDKSSSAYARIKQSFGKSLARRCQKLQTDCRVAFMDSCRHQGPKTCHFSDKPITEGSAAISQ
jgi:hypothetical protein